jgi:hypothetical protein
VRKNKKDIAFVILIGFLLAITPRSFIHDCHDHVSIVGFEKSKHSIDQNDCDFCSYDIGDIYYVGDFQFFSYKAKPYIVNDDLVENRINRFSLPLFFRGPPVC